MSGESSTGWRTEVALVVALVLGLALIADLAARYELTTMREAATGILALASQVAAFFFARARQAKAEVLKDDVIEAKTNGGG